MRTLQVQFTSGRDVLGHYWGLLSGGGLAIEVGQQGGAAFQQRERVLLEVQVLSIKKIYLLQVQVLDVRGGDKGDTLMVAFLPHSPPDELLDAAWADGCDAPQRRSRRLPTHTQVRYDCLNGRQAESRIGQLVNLSSGGCCIEGTALPPPGTQVLLTTLPRSTGEGPSMKLVGRVRWTERPEGGMMGIEFLRPAPEIGAFLQTLMDAGAKAR